MPVPIRHFHQKTRKSFVVYKDSDNANQGLNVENKNDLRSHSQDSAVCLSGEEDFDVLDGTLSTLSTNEKQDDLKDKAEDEFKPVPHVPLITATLYTDEIVRTPCHLRRPLFTPPLPNQLSRQ